MADQAPNCPTWALRVDPRPRQCRSCNATIYWCVTKRGKRNPLDPSGESHFATCPNASKHRRASD